MSAAFAAAPWLAFGLMLGAIAAALGAAMARSMAALSLFVATAGAFTAAALLAFYMPDAALGVALLSVGLAPFVLLSVLLLSARTARPRKGVRPVLAIIAAVGLVVVLAWAMPELDSGGVTPLLRSTPAIAFWIAPLVFVGVLGCFALLGFGERGAFEGLSLEREP